MKEIIHVERKRILNLKAFFLFLAVVLLFSVGSSHAAVKNYEIPNQTGVAVSWNGNLSHGRENSQGIYMGKEYLLSMKDSNESLVYLDSINAEALVSMNYGGKAVRDLTDTEIASFYSKRLSNIREMLENSSRITYTENEKRKIMEQAGHLSLLAMDYAEGWKVLNKDLGKFMPILLILTSAILLPLFGSEPQTKMNELSRSTRYGKKKLDRARVITAFAAGVILYLFGIMLYFIIKMVPFGLEGGHQLIQSNATTFFSVYNITYMRQFLINAGVGLLAMLFMISLTLLLTVLTDGILAGAVGIAFFWIMLLIFDQVPLYSVDHYFANFMPLKMTDFQHYYVGNEIYRVLGTSITSLKWVTSLSTIISLGMITLTMILSGIKLQKGANRLQRRRHPGHP